MREVPRIIVFAVTILVAAVSHAADPSLSPSVPSVAVRGTTNRYLFVQPNASAAASISFTRDTVRIAPMRPGGRVVLFTASLQNSDGILGQSTGAKMFVDDDGDGAITYTRARGIPFRSIWIAIDALTGQYEMGSPSEFLARLLPFPTSSLKRDLEGVLGLYDREQLSAEMVIVRPGEGAWRLRAHEGSHGDADKTRNGKLSLASGDAIPIPGTSTPAPKKLRPGDVIAVIDPARLKAFVTEIGQ